MPRQTESLICCGDRPEDRFIYLAILVHVCHFTMTGMVHHNFLKSVKMFRWLVQLLTISPIDTGCTEFHGYPVAGTSPDLTQCEALLTVY